ncbi:prepilin peptidase [Ferrimonas lipolytica]|uniref:Prepilin leader peptidase/N-methyltransferase n=1 Tax=Ferrimonas lipolytica TaxID=2724191 RepID=A0A6H1UHG5_9GAMM|nr:A24 family peptidase [Ferrimonas lipolytica]QIZ78547.1 prepilin peptidase [Ferrimonas lipolytica]
MAMWLELFAQYNWLFLGVIGTVSLLIGSFLNVVIHRLPIMMERQWLQECAEGLATTPAKDEWPERYNLITPGSNCPKCQADIPAWRNIPLISYLSQRGKCHNCHSPISIRYPLVELLTALLCVAVAAKLGPTGLFLGTWLLCFGLIAAAAIDFDKMLLPDSITLPLLWLGLLLNIDTGFVTLADAVLGAAFGYLSLWSIFQGFKLLTGKEGMGYGDFKLLALFGAWFGWQALLPIILISSIGGAVVGIALTVTSKLDQGKPMPFGPWIIIGGLSYLFYGPELVNWYLHSVVGL